MNELLEVPLVSKNGVRGKVLTASRLLDNSSVRSVIFESGRQASVPFEKLQLRADGSYYLDLTVDPRPADASKTPGRPADVVIPVIQESASVIKRLVETGRVRVTKTVLQEQSTVDVAVVHEEYDVQRVPMNRVVESISPTRVDGRTTIIPVYEEETVTVKRLILREEIHLIKKQRTEHNPRSITLRRDHVEIERIPVVKS